MTLQEAIERTTYQGKKASADDLGGDWYYKDPTGVNLKTTKKSRMEGDENPFDLKTWSPGRLGVKTARGDYSGYANDSLFYKKNVAGTRENKLKAKLKHYPVSARINLDGVMAMKQEIERRAGGGARVLYGTALPEKGVGGKKRTDDQTRKDYVKPSEAPSGYKDRQTAHKHPSGVEPHHYDPPDKGEPDRYKSSD